LGGTGSEVREDLFDVVVPGLNQIARWQGEMAWDSGPYAIIRALNIQSLFWSLNGMDIYLDLGKWGSERVVFFILAAP